MTVYLETHALKGTQGLDFLIREARAASDDFRAARDDPAGPNPVAAAACAVFCSAACRRAMAMLRDELPLLEEQLVEARRQEGWGNFPGAHYWSAEVRRLELAIDEARLRVRPALGTEETR